MSSLAIGFLGRQQGKVMTLDELQAQFRDHQKKIILSRPPKETPVPAQVSEKV